MKILIASDSYIYQTSGVATVVTALADGLRLRGHEVRILAPANTGKSRKEGDDYFIRSVPAFFYPDVRLCPARDDPLLDELIQWKPDLIHLHTEASMARMARKIAKKTNAPLVMTTHTDYAYYIFGPFHLSPPARLLMEAYGKRVYRNAAAVIVPSEKAKSFAMVQMAADRVTVIPNGIRQDRFQKAVSAEEKAELFRRYGLKDGGCTLVMITRVSREKNIMEILRFFPALLRALPEAQLVIAGDGPDRERLEKYCAAHRLQQRVCFTGRIDPDDVYRYYALGDIFVSASVFEVHSMSYLEALSRGLPLVCREDKSLLGVLENGENGMIYRSEKEFIAAVQTIAQDRALRASMHEKALEKAKEFTSDRFVEHTLALYEQVLKG